MSLIMFKSCCFCAVKNCKKSKIRRVQRALQRANSHSPVSKLGNIVEKLRKLNKSTNQCLDAVAWVPPAEEQVHQGMNRRCLVLKCKEELR